MQPLEIEIRAVGHDHAAGRHAGDIMRGRQSVKALRIVTSTTDP